MAEVKTTFVNGINPFMGFPHPKHIPEFKLTGPCKVIPLGSDAPRGGGIALFKTMARGDAVYFGSDETRGRTVANLLRRYLRVHKLEGTPHRNTQTGLVCWR